ncbi:hypothetical protein FSP39_014803 [Pinctada imbricata]|uniref:Phytanoyl-CoA dioxygenase n=1 Tax=Pinctada imbricata TaxID=66713 RepID=A0AA89BUR9_PINIB|nr:hypothetical protein FSP39_014803 [Pinctada imbricata]
MAESIDRTEQGTQGEGTLGGFTREKILAELESKGYVVIPGVVPRDECDKCIAEYKAWLAKFDEHGIEFKQRRSVIQSYRVGHFAPSWRVRLKAKTVFARVWGTEKLLSSIDGIAISQPPEKEGGEFRRERQDWLHLDQGAQRNGLHAYQGAVYLEEQTKDDYCFRVLEKSHKYHSEFFETFPRAIQKTARCEFYKMDVTEKKFYYDKGAELKYVPVPKGGIVLWDSRTVHDNNPPARERTDPNRWRFVVFVSMTPAQWASNDDIRFKKDVYRNMNLTAHWSSQGQTTFKPYNPKYRKRGQDEVSIQYLPPEGRTKEAKQLAGMEPYDFYDDEPNGPDPPIWRSES